MMKARLFRPHGYAILIALIVIATCLRLAWWQQERAATKAHLQSQLTQRFSAGPITLTELLEKDRPSNYPVHINGQADNSHTILLDNRVLDGIAGYHVLTPVRTPSGHWLLINRGWLARGGRRDILPDVPALSSPISLNGRSYLHSENTFTLTEDDLSTPKWPLRVQTINMTALSQALGVTLLPFEVRAEAGTIIEQEEQLPRVWHHSTMGPERHKAYAVQWYALAATALILFLVSAFRTQDKHSVDNPNTPSEPKA